MITKSTAVSSRGGRYTKSLKVGLEPIFCAFAHQFLPEQPKVGWSQVTPPWLCSYATRTRRVFTPPRSLYHMASVRHIPLHLTKLVTPQTSNTRQTDNET